MPRPASKALAQTFLVMSALFLQTSIAGAQECRKDSDCPGDTVCDEGRCAGGDGPAAKPKSIAPGTTVSPAPGQAGQPAPLPGAVKVEFVPRDPKDSLVVRDRYTNASCTAPCTLELPPGTRAIQVGSSNAEDFEIPAQGGTFSVAEPQRAKRNVGIVLLSVGAPVALIGALVAVAASKAEETDSVSAALHEQPTDNSGAKTGGIVVATVAGGFAVLGLVCLLSADTKALRPETSKSRAAGKLGTLLPTASVDTRGGGFFGLTGTF